MALSFPNSARSYDEAHARVRFVGHDGMFEVRFYVLADRSGILTAAKSAYTSQPDNAITLTLDHFD